MARSEEKDQRLRDVDFATWRVPWRNLSGYVRNWLLSLLPPTNKLPQRPPSPRSYVASAPRSYARRDADEAGRKLLSVLERSRLDDEAARKAREERDGLLRSVEELRAQVD